MDGKFLGINWEARGEESQHSAWREWASCQQACLLAIKFPTALRKNSLPCTYSVIQANIF